MSKTCTVSEAVSVDKTNIIVGTYNSDDYVDRYFKENILIDNEGLFNKYDSYILSINDGVIAVLGKDTDAAFHGITSLKHIFKLSIASPYTTFTSSEIAKSPSP